MMRLRIKRSWEGFVVIYECWSLNTVQYFFAGEVILTEDGETKKAFSPATKAGSTVYSYSARKQKLFKGMLVSTINVTNDQINCWSELCMP